MPAAVASPGPVLRQISDRDLASFKALEAEVCLSTDDLGEVWLVPAYTGQARREVSLDHAALLAAVCSAFPGARVIRFDRTPRKPVPSPP